MLSKIYQSKLSRIYLLYNMVKRKICHKLWQISPCIGFIVLGSLNEGKTSVCGGVWLGMYMGKSAYLRKLAIESEVADIKGSTATGAPLSKSEIGKVHFYVCPHTTDLESKEK